MATQPLVSVGEIGDSTPYNVILVAQSDMRDKNERKTRAKDALKLELRKVDLCSQDVGGKPYVGNGPGLNLVKLATQLHEFQKHQEERFALQDQKIASQDQKTASQDQKIASQDQKIASQNQKIASQNQKIASQNQKITSQDRKIASQDRKITSQEKEIISDRAEFTSQKREIAEQRKKISRQEKVIGSHKGKFDRLREKLASQEEETARLRHESLSLRTSLKDYMQVRNRFISTFRRDKVGGEDKIDHRTFGVET